MVVLSSWSIMEPVEVVVDILKLCGAYSMVDIAL